MLNAWSRRKSRPRSGAARTKRSSSSCTSLRQRSRALASIMSKICTFFSATRLWSDLRTARCTTEKWPLPIAFSTT